MKQTLRNTILLLVALAVCPWVGANSFAAAGPDNDAAVQTAGSQPQCQPQKDRRFSPEEYVKKCDAFMIKEAKITPSEAKDFFPLYHEMKDKQRSCEFEKGKLERQVMKQMPDDKECQRILNRINALNKQIESIEESYQKKLLKVVSPSKLLSAKIAEKKFERRMLRNMVRGPRQGNPRDKKGK